MSIHAGWLKHDLSIAASLDAGTWLDDREHLGSFKLRGSAAVVKTFRNIVTLSIGAAFDGNAIYEGHTPRSPFPDFERDLNLTIGSVQSLGLRPVPLVEVQFLRNFAWDLFASLTVQIRSGEVDPRFVTGPTFTF